MFGIFDPPIKKIAKKVPTNMQLEYVTICSLIGTRLSHFDDAKKQLSIGFIASIWFCNNMSDGKIAWNGKDMDYVMKLGLNSIKFLNIDQKQSTERLLIKLLEEGLIPASNKV